MNSNARQLEIAVINQLMITPTEPMTEERIRNLLGMLRAVPIFAVSDQELADVERAIHAKLSVVMDTGIAITEDYIPWLSARKASIEPHYWNRFQQYLIDENWAPKVVSKLEEVSDAILDLSGDPAREGSWERRGLVVGDVQSGKTATYTGLTCKAADAGYKIVILLTGTLENLRQQTQERMDLGFIGFDSDGLLSREKTTRTVGVGLKNQQLRPIVFTSRERDFNANLARQLGLSIHSVKDPILLVVKKNKRILDNLRLWLRTFSANREGIIEKLPLLLIDDEADNASVNTKSDTETPTAINECIRQLLRTFRQNAYVGFTATPFANIFIDPDSEDQMSGQDLFPRHFIYALESPTNYFGVDKVFADPDGRTLIELNDIDTVMPVDHKSSFRPDTIPPSLADAVRVFVITNAIRDLRQPDKPTHRSMLVNVSRFTAVQDSVATLIVMELQRIKAAIQNYSKLEPAEALANAEMRALRDSWRNHLSWVENALDWRAIQTALKNAALGIEVRAINQRTGAASLNYSAHKETGLRVIAVGGNSLSRGLTLEGLSTSYFYRNSRMYDTLLQMGRWFGYRDGYQDLCRIWMTGDAVHWYSHIAGASSELRQEIKSMSRLGRTPMDFGLKVRAHPDSLLVTASNKMRTAHTVTRQISFSGQGIETPELLNDSAVLDGNWRSTESFLRGVIANGVIPRKSPWNNWVLQGIASKRVADFLRSFTSHPLDMNLQANALADFLENTAVPELALWDICVPTLHSSLAPSVSLAGLEVWPRVRRIVLSENGSQTILISGSNRRVGQSTDDREGMSNDEALAIEAQYVAENPGKAIPGNAYRAGRNRPLLLLHVVVPREATGVLSENRPVVALGLSFPVFEEMTPATLVTYKINMIAYRDLVGDTEIDDDVGDVENQP